MLTKEERAVLELYTALLRKKHAHEYKEIEMPVHIGTVMAGMPELASVRAERRGCI